MKLLVVFPTQTEAQFFSHPQVISAVSGVGLSATAYSVGKLIGQHKPDWILMAGIAGVYQHSSLNIGDVVLVERECEADLGFFTPGGFTHLADLNLAMDFTATKWWACPYVSQVKGVLPLAQSNSMNAAMAPFIYIEEADIENMEGAAFFQVCLIEQQKFLEVRSVSNNVKIGDDDWDMEGSIRTLTKGLHKVVDHLLAAAQKVKKV